MKNSRNDGQGLIVQGECLFLGRSGVPYPTTLLPTTRARRSTGPGQFNNNAQQEAHYSCGGAGASGFRILLFFFFFVPL